MVKEEFAAIGDKLPEYAPKIGEDFTRSAQLMLTPAIRADLINLMGLNFSFRGDNTFPEERVRFLENVVNKQINAILQKGKLYTIDVFPSPKVQNEQKRLALIAKIEGLPNIESAEIVPVGTQKDRIKAHRKNTPQKNIKNIKGLSQRFSERRFV